MPRSILSCLLPLLLSLPGCSDDVPSGHDSSGHESSGHAHADAQAEGGAEVHGQDERGLVFLDPQHPAHPNWVDVGDLELGDSTTATVRMRNVEDHAITIDSVLAGCSCTIPSIAALTAAGERIVGDARASSGVLVVPPQAVVELTLFVDSRLSPARNKDKLVVVRLTTDDDHDPYLSIELRMKVLSAFQCVPTELDLARIPRNGGALGRVDIATIGDSGRRLLDVLETGPEIGATLAEASPMGVASVWSLHVAVRAPLPLGPQQRVLRISTTDASGVGEGRPYEVKVRWTATEDVEVAPARMLFLRDGELGREIARTELFARLAGQTIAITGASIEGPGTEGLIVQTEPAAPVQDGRAARWRISVDPGANVSLGKLAGRVIVTTDDANYARFEIPIARR
ncbi:MAG: DUF1573 domain-containing protein [Planctomycetes bacterium]|nr:DUF1573 domain-containing protein [Planctomycetota bacterium]